MKRDEIVTNVRFFKTEGRRNWPWTWIRTSRKREKERPGGLVPFGSSLTAGEVHCLGKFFFFFFFEREFAAAWRSRNCVWPVTHTCAVSVIVASRAKMRGVRELRASTKLQTSKGERVHCHRRHRRWVTLLRYSFRVYPTPLTTHSPEFARNLW